MNTLSRIRGTFIEAKPTEVTMKQLHCPLEPVKALRIVKTCFLTVMTALLISPLSVFAATEFQGKLNSVSITDVLATNTPPIAKFTYTQEGSNTLILDASESTDPDGTISEFKWDFGDGYTGSGPSITHQYIDSAPHQITLTVLDSKGGVSIRQTQYSSCNNSISNSDSNSASLVIYSTSNNETLGQSFIGNGKQLCSITVRIYSVTGDTTSQLTARVGTSQDLSSSYFEADSTLLPTQVGADLTFEWTNGPILTEGKTYYFMIHNPGSKWSSRIDLQATNTSAYAGGIAQSGKGWLATDYSNSSWDLSFEIGTK
jgi:hypothetical protein